MNMEKVLPKSFNELVETSNLPVLVDFWAEWCGPCKMIAPSIEKIASEFKGRVLTVKVNVDEKPSFASQYQISGIPTIMMFHKGKILMRLTGGLPYPALRTQVLQHLPT
jgi:thioredoxin